MSEEGRGVMLEEGRACSTPGKVKSRVGESEKENEE